MKVKRAVIFATAAHLPQIVNIVKGKSRRESRVIADKEKFWNWKVKALHAISVLLLIKD